MKTNKGITLIALIITIIVMLILVGVTVNVALNGGLFDTARYAKSETIKERDREELYSAVAASYDAAIDTISQTKLQTNLGDDWEVTGGENGPWTCTSKNGNSFTVDENGTILLGEEVEMITFHILINEGLLDYTVSAGTTWEEFILNENPQNSFVEEGITYSFPIFTVEYGEVMCAEPDSVFVTDDHFPVGSILVAGGGPLYEGSDDGFPEDPALYAMPRGSYKTWCYILCCEIILEKMGISVNYRSCQVWCVNFYYIYAKALIGHELYFCFILLAIHKKLE